MATESDQRSLGTFGVSLGVHNRKLRNIRPSGAFWPEVTLWNVTRSERRSRDPFGVRMRNRKLCNIRPSGAFSLRPTRLLHRTGWEE
jgi:hypothetical protein